MIRARVCWDVSWILRLKRDVIVFAELERVLFERLLRDLLKATIWRKFTFIEHILVDDAEGSQMWLIEVSVNFLEAAVLVTEVASLAIGAEFLTVELPAVLRLIFVIKTLFLFVKDVLMSFAYLF